MGRDDAALREQRQQTDGFYQHGLAAGVGTGERDGELVRVHIQVERDDEV